MGTHEAVSTGGSPWRILVDGVVQDGTHSDQHKALARAFRLAHANPAAEVVLRREAEIRVDVDLGEVVEPEPEPEPTGDHPHEPSEMTVITDVGFEAFPPDGWWDYSDPDTNRIISDPDAPMSPPDVYENLYPSGCGQSSSCGTLTGVSFWDRNVTEAYLDFWWKMSGNWQGHSSGVNKILYLTFADASLSDKNRMVINCHTTDQGPAKIQVRTQDEPGPRNLGQNVGTAGADTLTRGQWHRIEVVVVASDPGAENGEVHLWLDETKIVEVTDIRWIGDGEQKRIGGIKYDPIWGGNDPSESIAEDMSYFLDHVYGSGR